MLEHKYSEMGEAWFRSFVNSFYSCELLYIVAALSFRATTREGMVPQLVAERILANAKRPVEEEEEWRPATGQALAIQA